MIEMTDAEKFKDLYKHIFDVNGDTKACGRVECIRLIILADKVKSGRDYGDKNTGFMNIGNMHELYVEVCKGTV